MTATTNRYRLHIDWTKCDGRGLCTELLQARLGRDKWGYPVAKTDDPEARSDVYLSGSELEAANDAVDLCPLIALSLIPPTGR